MAFTFDERTARRLIREAKRSMRAPRTRKKRERRFRAIGGGGAIATIVHGLAGSNVSSGQYTITLSEATVMQGFISSSVTTITAADTHSWGIVDGQLVWVMLEKGLDPSTDIFQTFQAGCPPEA